MAPEIMVSLRKPGNDQDADGPSRSILVKKCAIYMDEVAPYCKISEVLPKLGQEYTPAKSERVLSLSLSWLLHISLLLHSRPYDKILFSESGWPHGSNW